MYRKKHKKPDLFIPFFIGSISLFVATLLFISLTGICINTRDWKRIYRSADSFEFARQSIVLTNFVLRDNEGKDICMACVDCTNDCFVMRDNEIVLSSTNRYYSKRLAKKLMKKLPDNAREVFKDRTIAEFEKHLKDYYKNND